VYTCNACCATEVLARVAVGAEVAAGQELAKIRVIVLITQRSQVQILPPLPFSNSRRDRPLGLSLCSLAPSPNRENVVKCSDFGAEDRASHGKRRHDRQGASPMATIFKRRKNGGSTTASAGSSSRNRWTPPTSRSHSKRKSRSRVLRQPDNVTHPIEYGAFSLLASRPKACQHPCWSGCKPEDIRLWTERCVCRRTSRNNIELGFAGFQPS
jgi:hypothetical protein